MISQQVEIPTAAGTIGALLVRPDAAETLPGVIQLTDGLGFRQAHADLSKRIAQRGYVVLTPNIFYRTTRPPAFDFEPDFSNERTMNRFRELTSPLTPDAMVQDGAAYVDFLAAQPPVGRGPMGVVGFCFAGQFALRTAAARPDRIAAAASFHGGRLVTDDDQSPHLVLPRVKARLYFGHADHRSEHARRSNREAGRGAARVGRHVRERNLRRRAARMDDSRRQGVSPGAGGTRICEVDGVAGQHAAIPRRRVAAAKSSPWTVILGGN